VNEVAQAIEDGRTIAVVEGEKDAQRLWSIGIAATCNAHGASEPRKKLKWNRAHSEQLKGADIVVFNDNDPAGYEHAETTCRRSLGVARRLRRLELKPAWPKIAKGGDVGDWLAAGHDRDELAALIDGAPDYAPKEPPPTGEQAAAEKDEAIAKLFMGDIAAFVERAKPDPGFPFLAPGGSAWGPQI
jgi:DNA primase